MTAIDPRYSAPAASQPVFTRPPLYGYQLVVARFFWFALTFFSLALFVIATPARFAAALNDSFLYRLAVTPTPHIAYTFVAIEATIVLFFFTAGAIIFWRKSNDWMVLFVSLSLIIHGVAANSAIYKLALAQPAWGIPATFLLVLDHIGIILFLYLFPDGRFVPRWIIFPAALWIAWTSSWLFRQPLNPSDLATYPPGFFPVLMVAFASGVAAQAYRYLRVSNPVERQQTKWVVFGAVVSLAGFFGFLLPLLIFPALRQPENLLHSIYLVTSIVIVLVSMFVGALSIVFSVLCYRLWDIDPIINRAVVYGVLSVAVASLYILVVGALGMLFQAQGSFFVSLLATGLVAVLFHPLRERLQRSVNRLMYGERDEPGVVLARLGRRLETAPNAEAILPAIVETVAQALKLPYTAVLIKDVDGVFKLAAAYGSWGTEQRPVAGAAEPSTPMDTDFSVHRKPLSLAVVPG